jgi:hypothetical protein
MEGGGGVAAAPLETGRAPISSLKTNLKGLGSSFGCHAAGLLGVDADANGLALCATATAASIEGRPRYGRRRALVPSVSIPLAFYLQEPLHGSRQI